MYLAIELSLDPEGYLRGVRLEVHVRRVKYEYRCQYNELSEQKHTEMYMHMYTMILARARTHKITHT